MRSEQELRKKVGQLMVCGFTGKSVSPEIRSLIEQDAVGGVILFARNIGKVEEVLRLNTELQLIAKRAGHERPLLICTDQENGVVRRLGEGTTIFPGAMLIGATGNAEHAYNIGVATGKELKALGVNWNLAPTVDVNNNPLNPVIGVRSYGENPDLVARFGQAAMRGMQQAGVITTLKHFPGHGDTQLDSHLELPTISHNLSRLQKVELKPFQACIAAGADVIMTSHIYFPALEGRQGVPATVSSTVISGLLRQTLQFEGVVTTDCLEMNAISRTIGTVQGAVEAIKAGVDLIMISHSAQWQKEAIEALVNAVKKGEIDAALIEQAYDRVRRLKLKYLSWDDIPDSSETVHVPVEVGGAEHQALAESVYRQGVTLLQRSNLLPLSPDQRLFVVYPHSTYLTQVEDDRYCGSALGQLVRTYHPEAEELGVSHPPTEEEIRKAVQRAAEADVVIVATVSAARSVEQQRLIKALCQTGKAVIIIAMRSPYDLAYLPPVEAYIATYEFTPPALRMAVKALFGVEKVGGTLPVSLPQDRNQNAWIEAQE